MSGLPPVGYRIGTFASFRAAMLARVADPSLFRLDATPNPFAGWKAGTDGDFETLFIELWAYLADVLTFYQERIANEAYLPTASERDALVRIAQLVDYAAAPGAAAETFVAFTLDKNVKLTIPARTRVASRGAGGKPPVTFETHNDLAAASSMSRVPFSKVALVNQFAKLSSFQTVYTLAQQTTYEIATVERAYRDLYDGFGTFGFGMAFGRLYLGGRSAFRFPVTTTTHHASTVGTRRVTLEGTALRLAPGDPVLAVQQDGTDNATGRFYRLVDVVVDRPAKTTTVSWAEPPDVAYDESGGIAVAVYALRVKAACFGNTAPPYDTISRTLRDGDPVYDDAKKTFVFPGAGGPYPASWEGAQLPQPMAADQAHVLLDAHYAGVRASQAEPGWAVLVDGNSADGKNAIYRADGAEDVAVTGYTLSAKVTQLRLKDTVAPGFPIRTTSVYTGAELLARHDLLPLPDPVSGAQLVLDGVVPDLVDGQTVIVGGDVYDAQGTVGTAAVAELATIKGAPVVDLTHKLTLVPLAQPLQNPYSRATAALFGNVVGASQGETVRDEPLGVGNGTALQRFTLAKSPLTYVASADTSGGAVASTLTVSVDGARWAEAESLLGLGPTARAYEVDRPPDGGTVVTFGDGLDGARPATGASVHARYRRGLGTTGNVAPNAIANMVDRAPGMKSVANPVASAGGADAESGESIRTNAPARVRTFERAIALDDLAALAQTYPGVAKARAAWRTRGDDLQAIAHPYLELTVATDDGLPLAAHAPRLDTKLRAFLDAHRDPNVPLRLLDAQRVPIVLQASVEVDPNAGRDATLGAARAAAGLDPAVPGFFALAPRPFGERIPIGAMYALLQDVPGVANVVITSFSRAGDLQRVADAVQMQPREIAQLDPSAAIVLAGGGYADR
jgi:predicted phage baseplate assembly protein